MAYNTIKVKKYSDVIEEYTATAVAITPNMLIELASATTVQAHSTEAGNALPMFALEDALQGNGIADNYAVSSKIQCWIPYRGDIVYAIIEDGTDIAVGDFLESNGAGLLQLHVADAGSVAGVPNAIIGQAIEAVAAGADSSLNSSVSPLGLGKRILVRII